MIICDCKPGRTSLLFVDLANAPGGDASAFETAMPVKSADCNVHSVDSSSATTAEGLASFERHFSENFYYIWGYEYSKYRGDTSTRSTVHAHM